MTNFLYNPDRKSKDRLIAEFVVRTRLLEDIMQDIESSDMDTPEQHYLLVGQRGTGKTTMLHRIRYATEDNKELNKWLIPVIFSEEQYNISELANLWETVAHTLEDYHGFAGISKEMEMHIAKDNFEEYCYDILEKHLEKHNKKLVLLIDNVGDILKKLEDKEVRRLREILQTKSFIRLIAGSPFYLDSILDYKQPFFEFFKVIRLEGLDKQETLELLLKLGDIYYEKEKIERVINETPERIETLRILTGGVPRTIALMFRIFIDHEHENSLKDLERVLDSVTPLYKHRMDDLSMQQQKIVDAVARNWDAISVKELKEKVRLDSKVISAQLRQLEKNQIIEKRETSTKNHIYLMRERFWNIWYLMRYGRKIDNEKVIWFVKFLEGWCSDSEFEKRINHFIKELKSGLINSEESQFYESVYASIKKIQPHLRYLLKRNISENISKSITITEEEALVISENYFTQNNNSDAIKVLLQPLKLSIKAKTLLFERLNESEWRELKPLRFEVFSSKSEEDETPDGVLVFAIYTLQNSLFLNLSYNKLSELQEIVDLMIEISNQQEKETFNVEIWSIGLTISYLIAFKQYNLAHKFFNETKIIDLKSVIKPLYYSLLYFSEGNNSEKLNRFGSEVKESSKSLIFNIENIRKDLKK
ncbi:MAG: ATP-binding protein [Parafilimonas sp.]